jgi:hypothetical protein
MAARMLALIENEEELFAEKENENPGHRVLMR